MHPREFSVTEHKAELKEELPCSGLPGGGHSGGHHVDVSGAQSCEFTLCLARQTLRSFWLLVGSRYFPAAASGLPSLAGSQVSLATPRSQKGSPLAFFRWLLP